MDNFRKEFAQKLSETVITSTTSSEETERMAKELVRSITAILPRSIFKYRASTIRNIEALAKNMTYGVPMSFMNDPMDGLVYVDKEAIFKQAKFGLSKDFIDLVKSTKELPGALSLYMDEETGESILKTILQASEQEVEDLIKRNEQANTHILAGLDKFINDTIKELQETSLVASFSETPYNNSMWAYYAENHTGFVVEYAVQGARFDHCFYCKHQNSQKCKDNKIQGYLSPIIYQKERVDATLWMDSFIGQYILQQTGLLEKTYTPDVLFPHRICLIKGEQWAHEKEWRVVCRIGEPCEKGKVKALPTPIPSAIYYGAHIAPESLSMLRGVIRALSIENNREIREYQMKIDQASKEFKLTAVPL